MNKIKILANTLNSKYSLISNASDFDIFKDSSSLSEMLEMIKGGLDEYKDYLYESEANPEVIKLYEEGFAMIKNCLHLISGNIAEIDDKLESIT